jgi:quercetin dioxygenase-like cupin family protein
MRRVLFLAVVLVFLAALSARAQDPLKVDAKHHKMEFENAQVRVLRFTLGPHEKSPMHEHPANIVVYLTDAHVKFTYPDGKTEERHGKAGQVFWNQPVKHEAENVGDTPTEGIQIELKAKHAAAKAPAAKNKS